MDMEGKRIQFDSVALNVLSHLENFEEVLKPIKFCANDGASNIDIDKWERKNTPNKLPEDFKSFYSIFNGLSIEWAVDITGKNVNMGSFHFNNLDEIKLITKSENDEFVSFKSSDAIMPTSIPDSNNFMAYTLSTSDEFGTISILYRTTPEISQTQVINPEIWFFDIKHRWHFICSSFTSLFRIMIVHLGILGWTGAYTPEGLSLITQQWMNLFCKERLCVDLSQKYLTS
jgi:hypothetical protein